MQMTDAEPRRADGRGRVASALHFAGARYWTASVLPALVGTALPLWLRPPGFAFRWTGAVEFLAATVLVHAAFSFLQARFEHRAACGWTEATLVSAALSCTAVACALGLHLLRATPALTFVAYGLSVAVAGLLYVAPPVGFSRRPGGEIVLAMSMGLIPVLGAYLVQVGDLTRTVYLASLPIYAAMLLWVWTDRMSRSESGPDTDCRTLVDVFGTRFSGRVVVPALAVLVCVTIVAAVLSSSVKPVTLVALLLCVPLWRIVRTSWRVHADASAMREAQRAAAVVHAGICLATIASSLWAAAS